jgi:hypothetical protein
MVVSARPVMAEPEEEIDNMDNIERPLSPSEQMASQDTPDTGVVVVEEMSEEDSQVEIKAEESLEDANIEATIEEESAPKASMNQLMNLSKKKQKKLWKLHLRMKSFLRKRSMRNLILMNLSPL